MLNSILSTALILVLATPLAPAQATGSRNAAMGGTSVASSDYLEAALANPALLTHYSVSADDDWGLLLPTVSVFALDPDSMRDNLDEFEQAFSNIDAVFTGGGLPTQTDLDALAASLAALDQNTITLGADAGVVLAIPSESFALSLVIDGYLDANGFLEVDDSDITAIENALAGGALPDLGSEAHLLAAGVLEVGLAFAREFEFGGFPLSVGITPKMQSIEVFNYAVSADTAGGMEDDFQADQFRESASAFNVDLGLALDASESVTLGAVVRDLLAQEVETAADLAGDTYTYKMDPQVAVGAAWRGETLTLATDFDLTARDPYALGIENQFVRVGGELGWQWAQLRAGYRTDLEGNVPDMVTAGIGFSPFGVLHLDLAAAAGEDAYEVALALSFTF